MGIGFYPLIAKPQGAVKMKSLSEMKTPVFWAEGHPGKLDKTKWEIEISGLCNNPQTLTWTELQKLPHKKVDARLTSVTRWSVAGIWEGVSLSEIIKLAQIKPEVKYVRFWSYQLQYDTTFPLEIALREKTLLAESFNGHPLTEDYGGPVRVFCPYLWGYKSAKSVVKIEFLKNMPEGFWEQRGYTNSGKIEAGLMRDVNDNFKVKEIKEGEVTGFENNK